MIISAISAMPYSAYADDSGSCGFQVNYTFDSSTGTLTISGKGEMYFYEAMESPFYNMADLKSIVIESGVTCVGKYAFMACHNLTSVIIPSTVTMIANGAFFNCDALTDIKLPVGVKEIGADSFSCCYALESIEIPEGVEKIQKATFDQSKNLKTAIIPSTVTKIYDNAFRNTGLADVYYAGSKDDWNRIDISTEGNYDLANATKHFEKSGACGENAVYKIDFTTGALTISGSGAMAEYATVEPEYAQYADKIKTIEVCDGITRIGDSAFAGLANVTDVTLAESVAEIGDGAFDKMSDTLTINSSCKLKALAAVIEGTNRTWNYQHVSDGGVVMTPATPTASGLMVYTCTVCGEVIKYEDIAKCAKYANPLSVKGKTVKVNYKKLKKKNQGVARKKAITVSNAKGKVTYKKSRGNKKIIVSKAGKITVKKGLKKGTYSVKIKVTAAGNATYKAKTKTVTVKIRVK